MLPLHLLELVLIYLAEILFDDEKVVVFPAVLTRKGETGKILFGFDEVHEVVVLSLLLFLLGLVNFFQSLDFLNALTFVVLGGIYIFSARTQSVDDRIFMGQFRSQKLLRPVFLVRGRLLFSVCDFTLSSLCLFPFFLLDFFVLQSDYLRHKHSRPVLETQFLVANQGEGELPLSGFVQFIHLF